jgi:ubiquinone/menaquinone biosynthesis C-methylase UbiE
MVTSTQYPWRQIDLNSEDQTPKKILEMSGSYWRSCALHAAVRLDVFTAIGDEQLMSQNIAQRLNADQRAATMLLNALAAMGLLVKKHGKFSNSPASARYLSKKSPQYMGHLILHHHNLVNSWSQLDSAVKTGNPVRRRTAQRSEQHRESFLMGMFNSAMLLAPQLVPTIDLSDRHHLLDLGGGPGTYAIHFCLTCPKLKATVYDLPTTRVFAQRVIEKFEMTDRIAFMEGNYLEMDIEGTYDVAWLSHILHAEGPQDCLRIIEKAVAVLEPRGLIIVHDFILEDTMDGPLFPALFSLNMLLGTASGQAYSENQIMDMMAKAGVKGIHRTDYRGPNDSGIIMGVVG